MSCVTTQAEMPALAAGHPQVGRNFQMICEADNARGARRKRPVPTWPTTTPLPAQAGSDSIAVDSMAAGTPDSIPRSQTPDTRRPFQRIDSPMVGNALIERKDFGAGDSRTSTRPSSLWRTAGASIAEMASITSSRTSDFDEKLLTVDAVRRGRGYDAYVTRARARA